MSRQQPFQGLHPSGRAPRSGPAALLAAAALLALCPPGSRAAEPVTAAAVIARGEERFRRLADYECTVDVETTLGRKVEAGSGRFWFKQPRMLRLRVTRGPDKGCEVAVNGQGQIRGRERGLFSFVVKRLQPGDRRLRTMRGTSMLEMDWGSFFLRYRAAALRPDARIALAPRPGMGSPYQVIVTYGNPGESTREVYSIDPQRWIIVEGALYENDRRVEHVVFRDIRLDTGVAEGWFRL